MCEGERHRTENPRAGGSIPSAPATDGGGLLRLQWPTVSVERLEAHVVAVQRRGATQHQDTARPKADDVVLVEIENVAGKRILKPIRALVLIHHGEPPVVV